MPLFFLIAGILAIVVGINDRTDDLVGLLKEDFAPSDGSHSFTVWVLVIGAIGLLGSVKTLKPVSNAFLVLLVIVLLLSNSGFIAKFTQSIEQS